MIRISLATVTVIGILFWLVYDFAENRGYQTGYHDGVLSMGGSPPPSVWR